MQEIIESIAKSLYSEDCPQKEHSKIYKIHKYWARKPWYIVEKYITQYSNVGDTVMDPFCGSGCTGLEAVINGRNFKGQDLNPMALLVSKGTLLNNLDWTSFNQDVEMITINCREKILSLYQSEQTCAYCGSLEPINKNATYSFRIVGYFCRLHDNNIMIPPNRSLSLRGVLFLEAFDYFTAKLFDL